jgi:serine/threonine-protein kinase
LIGQTILHYEILALLGKGGMGEVYRAHDRKLGRDVALKILPRELSEDQERVARFAREARTLASLQHPNIASIYGFEDANGIRFLTMELAEGEDLSEHLSRGAIPFDESMRIARQIAAGLEAAHAKNVVHRDLKPANIKISADGAVKILDFGLARAYAADDDDGGNPELSPTITAAMTHAGVILGTAAYMSPEQARGRSTDSRADIWAFGVVLFEMLSGARLFDGETVSDTLASVLTREVDWSRIPDDVSPRVGTLLMRCLERNRDRRLRDIGEARIVLDDELSGAPDPHLESALLSRPASAAASRSMNPALVAMLLILTGAVGATAAWLLKPSAPPTPSLDGRFEVILPEDQSFSANYNRVVTISPDSKVIAYVAQGLILRSLDDSRPFRVPGTPEARSPAFSFDSNEIAYWEGGRIKRVSIDGGVPIVVGELNERPLGMSWAANGFIYVGRADEGIWRVSSSGGPLEQVIALDAGEYAHGPELLPSGEWILFTMCRSVRGWSDASIVAQSLISGERRSLVPRGREARYVPTGHISFVDAGTLFAVPFDLQSMQVSGGAVALETGLHMSAEDETGAAGYDFSDDGILVFAPPSGYGAGRESRLLFLDADGDERALPIDVRPFASAALSPDDRRVAAQINDVEGTHIWVFDVDRRAVQRLTTSGRNTSPAWSHDGRFIYFASDRDGDTDIWRRTADLSSPSEKILSAEGAQLPRAVTSDGEWLICSWMAPGNSDVARVSLTGETTVELLVEGPADELSASPSPDGRFICFQSDDTGRWDIHVLEIASGRRWIVSANSGFGPFWTRDGKQIHYRSGFDSGQVVDVTIDPQFSATAPRDIFPFEAGRQAQLLDITRDGQRALISANDSTIEGAETRPRVTVILNWFEELRQQVVAARSR